MQHVRAQPLENSTSTNVQGIDHYKLDSLAYAISDFDSSYILFEISNIKVSDYGLVKYYKKWAQMDDPDSINALRSRRKASKKNFRQLRDQYLDSLDTSNKDSLLISLDSACEEVRGYPFAEYLAAIEALKAAIARLNKTHPMLQNLSRSESVYLFQMLQELNRDNPAIPNTLEEIKEAMRQIKDKRRGIYDDGY
jgi:nucleoside-triphosphatase THEP1